ncbi:tyrosine-type recombinase/integrase [Bacteroides fragilis]|uniref:tyrosine-type recombinase/integrase n=1 Tax=Bacteroides fragilis TaxID=817 RepID=UPI001391CB0D|nr:tyrosine-type recombinase/integrase [Bacteroides fragilis]
MARHSWATLAHENDVPVSVISDCMGHTSEKTTRIYLDRIDTKRLDRANRLVINSLR